MEIKEVKEQPTLMVRLITPVSRISEVMGEVYGEIGAYLRRHGIEAAGAPYAMYYNMDMEALDLEMGFPVHEAAEGSGRIRPGRIPGGKVASAVHTGPYDQLEGTYDTLMTYVQEQGLEVEQEWMYEFYLNDPSEVRPEQLQTEIRYIVKG